MKKILSIITCLFLFTASILACIYIAWIIYPMEVSCFKLEDSVLLPGNVIIHNFNILMKYLTFPCIDKLAMPDFPSSASALGHFADVKRLFIVCQLVFLGTLAIIILIKVKFRQERKCKSFQWPYLVAALLPLAIAIIGLIIGFDNFFVLFHTAFFPGDSSWLFNPRTDPIILALPEEFFLHCFLIFFLIYEVLMWLAFIISSYKNKRI